MVVWIIKHFKLSIMIITVLIIPGLTAVASFGWDFYRNVVNSTEVNIRQEAEISEIKRGFNQLKSDTDTMNGTVDSIKEDTKAIKDYFMKRAVEK